MKVCLLGENESVHVQKWIKAISEQEGMDLHVISFDRGVKFEKVIYHPLKIYNGSKLDYLLNIPLVRSYIKKISPDLLHSHYATSYGFLGACSGFRPYIITGWGADVFDSPKNILMKQMLKYSFSKCDAITVLSEITRTEIKKLTGKEVYLIPFGIDITKFNPDNSNKSPGVIRIGTIRTLAEKYGVEYLIRAFAVLEEKHENIRLEIVGDGPLRSSLEKLVCDFGIQEKVTFHGYINQNENFKKYISVLDSFDIFCILSILDSETFGVAALEASAVGIPVVATSVGGLPEVIDSEKSGIIVSPKNVQETIVALERLIESKNLRQQMGDYGVKKVHSLYNWRNNVQSMTELYNSVLKK